MSGTDRLLVVTIFGKTSKLLSNRSIYHSDDSLVCYDLLTTSNMEDGLAGMEIDCATIHQSDTSTKNSAPLIEVLIIPLL